MSGPSSRHSLHLEPPKKSTETFDPGAHELSSEGDEDYFSDASEGRKRATSRPVTPVSPIPITRVEKVDEEPSYGEVPGTPAYEKRIRDAVPDEVEIVSPGRLSKRSSQLLEPPTTPGGTAIPRTLVEKIDPEENSYGDVPGTSAYLKRQMDAAPDMITRSPGGGGKRLNYIDPTSRARSASNVSNPELIVTPVEGKSADDMFGRALERQKKNLAVTTDSLERGPGAGSPTLNDGSGGAPFPSHGDDRNDGDDENDEEDEEDGNDFGDDFDDFEEGAQAGADDDFGDFGAGFGEPEAEAEHVETPHVSTSQANQIPNQSFPLIDFDALASVPELLVATQLHLEAMFPYTAPEELSNVSQKEPIDPSSPIFPSDRSRSLWKQLITPPPLQPPNWTQSRIRRLFLVSLGVPVDLDSLLPPSKQKKLILPDINLEPSPRKSESDKMVGSVARLKAEAANDSSASVDSTSSTARASRSRKPKGPPPPPELDLIAVGRLCATTNEKLEGFTDEELKTHVKELETMTEKTAELLEYWLKRRDGVRKEKEAFEGVIENLVRHARRVRK